MTWLNILGFCMAATPFLVFVAVMLLLEGPRFVLGMLGILLATIGWVVAAIWLCGWPP